MGLRDTALVARLARQVVCMVHATIHTFLHAWPAMHECIIQQLPKCWGLHLMVMMGPLQAVAADSRLWRHSEGSAYL